MEGLVSVARPLVVAAGSLSVESDPAERKKGGQVTAECRNVLSRCALVEGDSLQHI